VSGRRVVVVGAGGREHALARRLAADPDPAQIVVIPGNDGMEFERGEAGDGVDALAAACAGASPDLVVVGPEQPLADGLVDRLEQRGIVAFGPRQAAARIEASKSFAKDVMREAGVPTAEAETFERLAPAREALPRFGPPWVLKADGLAAGKGVRITSERAEADAFLAECLEQGRFGAVAPRVLIERWLEGEERSVMAVCDGERAALLPAARDYKRALDGDAGPNTGGMGAYAPAGAEDAGEARALRDAVVLPVLRTLARRGAPFRGVLYAGLMRTAAGWRVLEFNARFGDPETEVVLPLVEGSLYDLLQSAARGRLDRERLSAPAAAAVAVAIVDERYPDAPSGEAMLGGVAEAEAVPGVRVLFAAVRREGDHYRITGGRAAYVCAIAGSREEARARAYAGVSRLTGRGWRCRHDVAGTPRAVDAARAG